MNDFFIYCVDVASTVMSAKAAMLTLRFLKTVEVRGASSAENSSMELTSYFIQLYKKCALLGFRAAPAG